MNRELLDWSQPAMPQAVGWLARNHARAGRLDLSGLIVVVPGAEAGRRLLELLVAECAEQSWLLSPPQIVTPGHLPELLYKPKRPFASDLVQQLVWARVLERCDAATLRPLVHQPPQPEDLPAWLALARMLAHLHVELAADGLNCSAILEHGRDLETFNEPERWQLLARLQQQYLDELDTLELWDIQTARLFAIKDAKNELRLERQLVLVGVVDLNRSLRQMLDFVAERVTVLTFAPNEFADRFDDYGCVVPEKWRGIALGLSLEQIEIVDGPGDQADAVVRTLHGWNGRFSADEIAIGMPDPSLAPYVRQRLDEAGVAARLAAGTAIERSAPYQLLKEVADYLERRQFRDLAVLVRHPALARHLAQAKIAGDWLAPLDRFYADHLPAELNTKSLGSHRWAGEVRQVQGTVHALLGSFAGRERPLHEWADAIIALLTEVFGTDPLDDTIPVQRSIIRTCDGIKAALEQHRQLPPQLAPTVAAAAAIRLLLGQLDGQSIPPPADAAAIELLGWLELPWDDARALVVTGMNEGIVPRSRRGEVFLPDALRRRLNLEDNGRRYARDAYAVSLLAALDRPLKIIAGRRSPEGDPLIPSRLLLACGDAELPKRTRELLKSPRAAGRILLSGSLRPGQASQSKLPVPHPQPLAELITALRITELRDYAACKYRYYLRHQLGLEALSDWADEMDGSGFGNLLHDVLNDFGRGEAKDSQSEQAIYNQLFLTLGKLAADRFGEQPLPAVRVQIEMLRLRLEKFAHVQARRRSEGWRITETERAFRPGDVLFRVDDADVSLIGRVDRIDVNERTGEVAVLDYKSSDSGKSPDKVHREGPRDEKSWIDFQLPLYRYLVRSLGLPEPTQLGYVLLPKDVEKTAFEIAAWSADELAAADEAARAVIRGIRAGHFWPPTDPPPNAFGEFAAICQDDLFAAAAVSTEAGEDSP